MPDPRPMERSYLYIEKFSSGLPVNNLKQIIGFYAPELAERFEDVAQRLEAEMSLVAKENEADFPIEPLMPAHDTNPYCTINKARGTFFGSPEKEKRVRDIYNEAIDILAEVAEKEPLKQKKGIHALISRDVEWGKRAREGRDMETEIRLSTPSFYMQSIPVEFKNQRNEKGEIIFDPDTLNQQLEDMHYKEISELAFKHMDLMHEIHDTAPDAGRRQEISEELRSVNDSIIKEAQYLKKPETEKKVSPLFVDYKLNVVGARGVTGAFIEPASAQNAALKFGWDPAFVSDYMPLSEICRSMKKGAAQMAKIVKANEGSPLNDLAVYAHELGKLDPGARSFKSPAEFVQYYNKLSGAMKDYLEEMKKPEVQLEIERIQQAYENNQPVPGGISQQEFDKSVLNDSKMHDYHAGENGLLQQLKFFANRTDLEGRGITVGENGELKYSPEADVKTAQALRKMDAETEKIIRTVAEKYNEQALVDRDLMGQRYNTPDYDQNFFDINATFKKLTGIPENARNYSDMSSLLTKVICLTEKFNKDMEENGPKEGADPDIVKARKKASKEIAKFAKDSLKKLADIKPECIDEAKPYISAAEELQADAPVFADYAANAGRQIEKAPKLNLAAPQAMVSLFGSPVTKEIVGAMFGGDYLDPETYRHFAEYSANSTFEIKEGYVNRTPHIYNTVGRAAPGAASFEYRKEALVPQREIEGCRVLDKAVDMCNRILTEKDIEKYPGMKAYFESVKTVAQRSQKEPGFWEAFVAVPGVARTLQSPDWRLPECKDPMKVYDQMYIDMKHPELFDLAIERTDIDLKLRNKTLTPEQSKEYRDKIVSINNKMIENYKLHASEENEKKYSGCYQIFGKTVSGVRGVHAEIGRLIEQNDALERGWDPGRINDYHALCEISKKHRMTAEMLSYFDNPALNRFRKLNEKLAAMDPVNYEFGSQQDVDVYLAEYAKTIKDARAEASRPAVKAGLEAAAKEREREAYEFSKAFEENRKEKTKAFREGKGSVVPDLVPPKLYKFSSEELEWAIQGSDDLRNELMRRCDPARNEFTGDPELARKRNEQAELLTKRQPAIDAVRTSAKNSAVMASKHLAIMERDIDPLKSDPSSEYTDVKTALANLSALADSECSYNTAHRALEALSEAADTYISEKDAIIKSATGATRLNKMKEIREFARDRLTKLEASAKGRLSEEDRSKSFTELTDEVDNKLGRVDPKMVIRCEKRNAAIDRFAADVGATLDGIRESVEFLKQDSASRKGGSETYKGLIEASKFLFEGKPVGDMKPGELYKNLVNLKTASDEYAREHKGMLAGNIGSGRQRYDASANISSALGDNLLTISKDYYGMQIFGSRDTLNSQKNINNNRIAEFKDIVKDAKSYLSQRDIRKNVSSERMMKVLADSIQYEKRPADEALQGSRQNFMEKDLAHVIAAKQIEKAVSTGKMTKEEQQSMDFEAYANGVLNSKTFREMVKAPEGKNAWEHHMDLVKKGTSNGGNELYSEFVNTTAKLAQQKELVNNAPKQPEREIAAGPQAPKIGN